MADKNSHHAPSSRKIEVHLTGFGRFGGVDDNPTTHLINHLPSFLDAELPKDGPLTVASYTVLEVSQYCVPVLSAMHATKCPAGVRKLYVR